MTEKPFNGIPGLDGLEVKPGENVISKKTEKARSKIKKVKGKKLEKPDVVVVPTAEIKQKIDYSADSLDKICEKLEKGENVKYAGKFYKGKEVITRIKDIVEKSKLNDPKKKLMEYIRFISGFDDSSLRHSLNIALIKSDPSLDAEQKIMDREQLVKKFDMGEAIKNHLSNLKGLTSKDKKDAYVNDIMREATRIIDKRPEYYEALQAALIENGYLKAIATEIPAIALTQEKPPEKSETGIPLFITAKLREDLKSLGVTEKEIDALKPEEAWELLRQKNSTKETVDKKPETSEAAQETEEKIDKTEKDTKKIIQIAKDILKNLPLSLKKLAKIAMGQAKKDRKTQGDIAKMTEDLRLAEEALAEAQKDKKISLSAEKKRFYENQWLKVAALAALLTADVKIAGTNLGWWGNSAPTGKTEQKNTAKKETEGIYMSTVTNLSAEVEKIKIQEEKNKAEADKKLADQQAEIGAANQRAQKAEEMAARIKAQMQVEQSAPVVQPKPITKEELLAGIEQKIMTAIKEGRDPNLTSNEATMWNMHSMNERPTSMTGGAIQTGQKEQVPPQLSITPEQPAMGGFIISRSGPGVNFDTPAKIHTNENVEKNPFHLTPKMLEKVEEVYGENIDKIFPNDTLQNWRSIKDKSASEFMGRPEGKIKKIQKPLYDYLKQLEEKTKLKPKSGILRDQPESIEKYIERALQKAAQEEKLDEVELQ